jgi:hypothetical protein
MATIKREGYGIVEPNHLSAPYTGQVYAQLPAASTIDVLENGTFVKYDYANGEVNFTGEGEFMLVLNEIKLYDERKQSLKDYAMLRSEAADGVITPRVFKTNVGDIMTTNMVKEADYSVGDKLTPGADGVLAAGEGDMVWQVVKVYTVPDGQAGLKLQRIL